MIDEFDDTAPATPREAACRAVRAMNGHPLPEVAGFREQVNAALRAETRAEAAACLDADSPLRERSRCPLPWRLVRDTLARTYYDLAGWLDLKATATPELRILGL